MEHDPTGRVVLIRPCCENPCQCGIHGQISHDAENGLHPSTIRVLCTSCMGSETVCKCLHGCIR